MQEAIQMARLPTILPGLRVLSPTERGARMIVALHRIISVLTGRFITAEEVRAMFRASNAERPITWALFEKLGIESELTDRGYSGKPSGDTSLESAEQLERRRERKLSYLREYSSKLPIKMYDKEVECEHQEFVRGLLSGFHCAKCDAFRIKVPAGSLLKEWDQDD